MVIYNILTLVITGRNDDRKHMVIESINGNKQGPWLVTSGKEKLIQTWEKWRVEVGQKW